MSEGVQNPRRGGANAPPSLFVEALSYAASKAYLFNDRQGARGFMVKYVTGGRNKEMTVTSGTAQRYRLDGDTAQGFGSAPIFLFSKAGMEKSMVE